LGVRYFFSPVQRGVFLPDVATVLVVLADTTLDPIPMVAVEPAGFFEATMSTRLLPDGYRLRVTDSQGRTSEAHDPYAFTPVLTEFDLQYLELQLLFVLCQSRLRLMRRD